MDKTVDRPVDNQPNPEGWPDLSDIVRRRLESPMPLLGESDKEAAVRFGMPILRQLTTKDSAPGGHIPLRMSSLGKCARALAYRWSSTPPNGRGVDGRSRATFAIGDMTEVLLTTALEDGMTAGLGPDGWKLKGVRGDDGQARVTLLLEAAGHRLMIPGHPDGVLWDSPFGGKGRPCAALEVKSGSSYAYTRADKLLSQGEQPWSPDEGYWWQAQGYLHAMDLNIMGVLMLCKDSGAFTSWWMRRDPEFIPMLVEHLERALVSDPEDAPRVLADGTILEPSSAEHYKRKGKRKDGSSYAAGDIKPGAGKLPWQCCYCDHYRTCYGDDLSEQVSRDWRGRPSRSLFLKSWSS